MTCVFFSFLLLLLFANVAVAKVFYVKSIGAQDIAQACSSIGLKYHQPLHENSIYHRCLGSDDAPSAINYQAEVSGLHLLRPATVKMSLKPVVNRVVLDAMSDADKRERAWYIPLIESKKPTFHANAYRVVADGFRAWNATLSVLGVAFAESGEDVPRYFNPYNAMDGSNNVYSRDEVDYQHDTKVVSVISGAGICVDGLAPDAAIHPIKVMNLDGMLRTDYFSAASYLQSNEVQLRTFGPDNSMPNYDDDMVDDMVRSTIETSMDRGGLYIVSGGNDGQRNNMSSARACFDTSIAGFHGMIAVGAFTPSGAVPSYVSRGCLFMSAPGGDSLHPMTLADGIQCMASAGTSFSAPIVAAAVAQMQALCNNQLSNSDVQDVFVRTNIRDGLHDAHGIGGYQYVRNGAGIYYSDASGFGRLDFRAAIKYMQDAKCPHMPAVVHCTTPVVSEYSIDRAVAFVNIALPESCKITRVKYVGISAQFSSSLHYISEWTVESPAHAIPCSLLPLQHPYTDFGKLYRTGCWSFYNETAAGNWLVRYKTLAPNVTASFNFDFYGFI